MHVAIEVVLFFQYEKTEVEPDDIKRFPNIRLWWNINISVTSCLVLEEYASTLLLWESSEIVNQKVETFLNWWIRRNFPKSFGLLNILTMWKCNSMSYSWKNVRTPHKVHVLFTCDICQITCFGLIAENTQ